MDGVSKVDASPTNIRDIVNSLQAHFGFFDGLKTQALTPGIESAQCLRESLQKLADEPRPPGLGRLKDPFVVVLRYHPAKWQERASAVYTLYPDAVVLTYQGCLQRPLRRIARVLLIDAPPTAQDALWLDEELSPRCADDCVWCVAP